jgi:hypothetical protein
VRLVALWRVENINAMIRLLDAVILDAVILDAVVKE